MNKILKYLVTITIPAITYGCAARNLPIEENQKNEVYTERNVSDERIFLRDFKYDENERDKIVKTENRLDEMLINGIIGGLRPK